MTKFPKFNEARGETASMQLIPPFQFTGVTMRVFPLRANRYLLQRFIDGQLNIIPPEVGQFRVFLPYVYLIVINYGKMAVTAANLGWIAQNEVAFSIPMMWQHRVGGRPEGELVQDLAYVSPFIYVDNPLSMTTGREVYGWPKVLGGFDPQLSAWMSNPTYRTQQTAMSVDVIREAYAGGRSVRRTLLEIDSAAAPSFGQLPPDVRNPVLPWNAARNTVLSSSALMGDSVEILRGLVETFSKPADRSALVGQVERVARDPSLLAVLNTVNLKQFRDAAEPTKFAYQAITNTPMTIRSFRRGGVLGDMRMLAGDTTGGYQVRIHNYDTQPIISMLGLEVESQSDIEGTDVANLAPVCPFWLEVDLDYPLAAVLAWRQKGSPGWFHADQMTPTVRGDDLYNTERGGSNQQIAGPFEFPNATVRVLPLQADPAKLQAFLDAYLGAALAGSGSRFEVWGSYVYMVVINDDEMISLSNNIGDLANREASLQIPVKWYDGEGKLVSTGLVPAYVYSNSAAAANSSRDVNGIPSMTAQLINPANSWLDSRGAAPGTDDKLMVLRGDVLPVLGLGQQAKTRTIMEVDLREPIARDDIAGWHRLAGTWVPPLKLELERKQTRDPVALAGLKALALELLGNRRPFSMLTLKQFRSAADPLAACYQALIEVPTTIEQLFEIEEIESNLHLRIHEYPSQAIVGMLGIVVKAWERGAGCQIAVVEPVRPFWFRAQLRQELGRDVHVWTANAAGGSHWTHAPERSCAIQLGARTSPTLVDAIEDGNPQHLADHVGGWIRAGRPTLAPSEVVAAIEGLEPQVAIESILSSEWDAWNAPRWIRGREYIRARLDKATAGVFPSEVIGTVAKVLLEIDRELRDPNRDSWGFEVHRSRPVGKNLFEFNLLAELLTKFQVEEEAIQRSIHRHEGASTAPDAAREPDELRARLEGARDELLTHLAGLQRPGERQAGAAMSFSLEPSDAHEPAPPDTAQGLEILQDVLRGFSGVFASFGPESGVAFADAPKIDDETCTQIVSAVKRAMHMLADQIIAKLAKSWQKPDHCVRRQTVLSVANDHFPAPLSFDDSWYVGVKPRLSDHAGTR